MVGGEELVYDQIAQHQVWVINIIPGIPGKGVWRRGLVRDAMAIGPLQLHCAWSWRSELEDVRPGGYANNIGGWLAAD